MDSTCHTKSYHERRSKCHAKCHGKRLALAYGNLIAEAEAEAEAYARARDRCKHLSPV